MALTVADLLEPDGPVQRAFFPTDTQGDLEARVGRYLAKAQTALVPVVGLTGAQQDEAMEAYVMYRALDAVISRVSAEAASVTIADQGGQSRTDTQLKTLVSQRDASLLVWQAYVPTESVVEPAPTRTRLGGAVRTRTTW
jgi:hypothetical protein